MKDDREANLCIHPSISPASAFSPHLSDTVEEGKSSDEGVTTEEECRGCGGQGGEKRREKGEVCWFSCVLAVGGRGLVGTGQVRVALPTRYAVQLCLYIAQAQLRT